MRIHEDRRRHTGVDHAPGGPAIAFATHEWCAIDVSHVPADRENAGLSAYETLVAKSQDSISNGHSATIFHSSDRRSIVVIVGLTGHANFRALTAAWDDHKLYAEHRAVAKTSSLEMFRVDQVHGDGHIDPASPDIFAFEKIHESTRDTSALVAAMSGAWGFCGTSIFAGDEGVGYRMLSRFARSADYEAFRGSAAARGAFADERPAILHPVKTFSSRPFLTVV